jgi:putative membrane protein
MTALPRYTLRLMTSAVCLFAPALAATAADMAKADANLLQAAAQFGRFEIEAGQMASARASTDPVREFARTVTREHLQAETELKALASVRKMALPTEPSAAQKKLLTTLGQKNGKEFDDAYVREAGIAQHRQGIAQLEKAQPGTKDPDMRSVIERGLPMMRRHLELAEKVAQPGGGQPTGSRHQGLGEARNPVPRTTAPNESAPPSERPPQDRERGTAVPTR